MTRSGAASFFYSFVNKPFSDEVVKSASTDSDHAIEKATPICNPNNFSLTTCMMKVSSDLTLNAPPNIDVATCSEHLNILWKSRAAERIAFQKACEKPKSGGQNPKPLCKYSEESEKVMHCEYKSIAPIYYLKDNNYPRVFDPNKYCFSRIASDGDKCIALCKVDSRCYRRYSCSDAVKLNGKAKLSRMKY